MLFHPRLDRWAEHFARKQGEIIGLTMIGRATVHLLLMNQHGRKELRASK
jgi:hypothetical protein